MMFEDPTGGDLASLDDEAGMQTPMTELEWLASTDPKAMLRVSGKSRLASSRRLRLLGCGCCRKIGGLLERRVFRMAVETAESYADGRATYGEMVQVAKAVEAFSWSACGDDIQMAAGVWHLVTMSLWWNVQPVRRSERTILALLGTESGAAIRLASVFRCLFGPLVFRPVRLAPSSSTADVVSIARSIYEERAFDRLPLLSDALRDAGCSDQDVLAHCRQQGEHVRGCWVVDLVLGKK